MFEKVKNIIKKYNLLSKADKVVVAVSGGPDSVALLYLLVQLKRDFKLRLHVAHLDHQLRKGSDKDRLFVENLAEKLKIPVSVRQVNLKKIARKGSLEEIARELRLDFLFEVAKDNKLNKIALGHTQDDQAETVLMRFLRGSGLCGLSSILPKRTIHGFTVIRPLIEISRREIEKYLKLKKIKTRTDYTNFQDIYLRNRIRNKLLPLLARDYNPNVKSILANTAEAVGIDYAYLLKAADRNFPRLIKSENKKMVNLKLEKFLKLDLAIQRLILRLAIARVKGDLRRITFRHIKEIEDLIYHRPFNAIVDLPRGIAVIKKRKYFSVYSKSSI